jgi:hypothetical protein
MTFERYGCAALACLVLSTAHAESRSGSVTLNMQGDENDNRLWLGKLGLALGDHAWVQGSVGKTELAAPGAGDTKLTGIGFGGGGQSINAAVEFVQRKGDSRFEQQDWSAVLNWRGSRSGLGVDGFLRSANGESTTTTRPGGVFGSPVTTTIKESVDSRGFGLHGDFNLTAQANVFAGVMRYQHDFNAGSSTTGGNTPLSFLLGSTNTALSGVSRDLAFIDRSYRVGTSYRFQSAAVSAEYLRDRITKTDETLSTLQLQAQFPVGEHWTISPLLGYSSGGSAGSVGFGGVSLGFGW